MTTAVCFRCDWQGRACGSICPSCGAPLYRADPGDRSGRSERADRDDRTLGHAAPIAFLDDEARLGEVPTRRGRPRGAAIAIAVTLALVAMVSVEFIAREPSPPRSASGRSEPPGAGTLVYLAREHDRPRLWVIDLVAGTARPGPRLPEGTQDLVDVSGASSGWVGVERRTGRDKVGVSVLRGVAPDADAVRLGHGDLVAWGPGGSSLVFARNGRQAAPAGCAPVRISLVTVVTEQVEWALDDPGFCGPVLSLSRSAAATYFTAASGDRLSVYLTGTVGVPHLMFEGVGLLSASPPAAFLLRPDASTRTSSGASREAETMLGWKGIGGPITVGDGHDVLAIDRILAWSADGSRVALLGTMGARSGVFVLAAGSGTGPRVPRFVMPAGRTIDGTFDAQGRLYLVRDGAIFVTRNDDPTLVPLSEGTPPPTGPIVWIP